MRMFVYFFKEIAKTFFMNLQEKYLEYKVIHNGYAAANSLVINTIELYGLFGFPKRVTKDGTLLPGSSVRSKGKKVSIELYFPSLILIISTSFQINVGEYQRSNQELTIQGTQDK